MIIPKKFEEILKDRLDLYANVLDVMSKVEPILNDNKLEFFPEYTDHGVKHIENVLNIAEKIISDDTYENLTPEDIQALIIAILLHDIGMHTYYDGFLALLNSDIKDITMPNFDDLSWDKEWKKYMKEAHLWGDNKKKLIFGEVINITDIPSNFFDFTNYHRFLCGEFLRRHHARLAQQIIVHGFLDKEGNKIDFTNKLDDTTKDVIAFIARSHGMNLWDALSYTEKRWAGQTRNVKSVNIMFIMVVVRIADFFDMDKTRTNSIVLSLHKLRSVISDIEWSKQTCIEYINFGWQEDPELAFALMTKPPTSLVFLEVEKLLGDIQNELDICWAVLGKVYGRYLKVGLSIRRINSNLDLMENNLEYIPERVMFSSDRGILNLLVKPLYGDNPSYGVRELIQNSVDACIEKEKIISEEKNIVTTYKPLVKIQIGEHNEGGYFFSIEDNGIGMTKDIIVNYFLNAGSSYRSSNMWKEKYTDGNESLISRSGKFGVGALACFILGEKIIVKTKGYLELYTYDFNACIDTNQIEINKRKSKEDDSGTVIFIEISKEVYGKLRNGYEKERFYSEVKWMEWYNLNTPKLTIEVPEDWKSFGGFPQMNLSLKKEELSDDWNSLYVKGLTRVDWCFQNKHARLLCNGILIPEGYRLENYRFPVNLCNPLISVIDNDGNLPLSLNRNSITDGILPFEKELVKQILEKMIPQIINYENITLFTNKKIKLGDECFEHDGIYKHEYGLFGINDTDFILNKKGYYLPFNIVIEPTKGTKITKIWLENGYFATEDKDFINKLDDIIFSSSHPNGIYDYRRLLELDIIGKHMGTCIVKGKRVFMKKNKYKYLVDPIKKRIPASLKQSMSIENESEDWVSIVIGRTSTTLLTIGDLNKYNKDIIIVVEYYLSENKESIEEDILDEVLREYEIKDKIIPYKKELRKQCFEKVFKDL